MEGLRTSRKAAFATMLLRGMAWAARPAPAQQTTGTPGSPTATTTIDGRYLPPPQPFKGEIALNAAQSKLYWPARVVPPKGATNILLIMAHTTAHLVALRRLA